MTRPTVEKVIGLVYGAGGQKAEVVYSDYGSSLDKWAAVNKLEEPKTSGGIQLLLSNQALVQLPADEIAHILPDRTGVLVVFDATTPPVIEGLPDFHSPHNAAIFNADGRLRFRLNVSQGLYIRSPFNRTLTETDGDLSTKREPINPPQEQYGVLVGHEGHLPDQFFLFDGTAELKATNFYVKY